MKWEDALGARRVGTILFGIALAFALTPSIRVGTVGNAVLIAAVVGAFALRDCDGGVRIRRGDRGVQIGTLLRYATTMASVSRSATTRAEAQLSRLRMPSRR
ncbi:hypothetical protein BH09MYX1_BH09MYX1_29810 [soil metagenome]